MRTDLGPSVAPGDRQSIYPLLVEAEVAMGEGDDDLAAERLAGPSRSWRGPQSPSGSAGSGRSTASSAAGALIDAKLAPDSLVQSRLLMPGPIGSITTSYEHTQLV